MQVKYKFLWILSLVALFLEVYRQFSSYSIILRGYVYILMWLVCCFLLCKRVLLKINYLPFLAFFFFSIIYVFRGGDYQNLKSISELITILSGYLVVPLIFMFYNNFCTNKKNIICVVLLLMAITYATICTAPVALSQPGLIRETASNEELALQFQKLGVMNYALPHCVVFILPALCFGIKYCVAKFVKLLCFLFVIEIFVIIYFSEASMPLLFSLVIICISFLYDVNKSAKINLIRFSLLLILILPLASESVIIYILDTIEPFFSETAFEDKIKELEMSMAMNEVSGADVEARQSHMESSISTFFDNPIFGTIDSKTLGCHNYLIDMSASLGLIGFIPLIIHLFYISKKIYLELPVFCRSFYLIGIGSFFLMLFFKNMWGGAIFCIFSFFLLPCLLKILGARSIFYLKN